MLLVDAAQGIEAQTLANLHLARDAGLVIVSVLNKIDLPQADVAETRRELAEVVGCPPEEVLAVSAKTGEGVTQLIDEVVRRVPPPTGERDRPLRALIFDSSFDPYRGVIAYLRVKEGVLPSRSKVRFMASALDSEAEEAGVFAPEATPVPKLEAGEVGYLVTGLKEIGRASCRERVSSVV